MTTRIHANSQTRLQARASAAFPGELGRTASAAALIRPIRQPERMFRWLSWLSSVISLLIFGSSLQADFTPVRPYLFMDQTDVEIMRDNVLVKQYPWAVALYQQARQCDKVGQFNITNYVSGRNMLGCALVYLIDGDTTYADGAVSWLKAFALKDWNPAKTSGSDFTHLHGILSITYDLMYNYMAAQRSADLTLITKWLELYAKRCAGNFGHNQNHQEHYGEAMAGYALGRTAHIDQITTLFKQWYDGDSFKVFDGFHYETGQAMKHWAIVFEGQAYFALASHRAAKRGYHSFDALAYVSKQGKNLLRDNWRMVLKKSTPRFQVPYETMWRGMLFDWSNCTGVPHSIYAVTGDSEWAAIAQQHPARDLDFPYNLKSQFCVMMYWAGLAHGRELVGNPKVRNDSFDQGKMGFTVMLSGDPQGHTTEDSLHAYLMHGKYGSVKPFNLLLYGKGERLNTALMESPNDVYGERGAGGSYVVPAPSMAIDPAPISLQQLQDPDFKIFAVDSRDQRMVAVTDRYFVDVYSVNTNGTVTFNYDGIGPSSSYGTIGGADYVSLNRTTAGNFTVTWPNHQKMFVINEQSSTVKLTTKTNLPNLIRNIYPSDIVRSLQIKRTKVVGSTRFISIIEPVGNGCQPEIANVTRFDSARKAEVTSLKIEAAGYTDYVIYAHTRGLHTLTSGPETIQINGAYGYVHYDKNTGATVTKGDVVHVAIAPAPLTMVSAPIIATPGTRHFEREAEVAITCATPDAIIYYTLDGSEPTSASPVYSAPFVITEASVVKARGVKAGLASSRTAVAAFTKQTYKVPAPIISPAGQVFASSVVVTLANAQPDAVIRYTLDGGDPNLSSPIYTAPLTITRYTPLRARGFKAGWETSPAASATFIKQGEQTLPPAIVIEPDAFNNRLQVTLNNATPGASIYYTTDGSQPTTSSALYAGAFVVGPFASDRVVAIAAIAVNGTWAPSSSVLATWTVEGLSAPLAHLAGEVGGEGILISWSTEYENRNVGWNIYRKTDLDPEFVAINGALIPGAGTTAEPQHYQFLDAAVPSHARSATYFLEQIDSSNRIQHSETVVVELGFVSAPLASFTAENQGAAILLRWSTQFEIGNLGWNIYRQTDLAPGFVRINEQLVPGGGTVGEPRLYEYLDAEVPDEATIVAYYLEQVDSYNRTDDSDPTQIEMPRPSAPLSSFSGVAQDGAVELTWTTLFEDGNLGWNIYRKGDQESVFSKINDALVPGAGISTEPQSYQYTDLTPPLGSGSVSYFLEQVNDLLEVENSETIVAPLF